jgi:hypothetical protein
MVAAAMGGLVDFRDADPADRRWWFKLRLALDFIERGDVVRQHRLYYDYSLAILSRDRLVDRSAGQFTRDAEKRIFAMINLWRPWEHHDPEQGQQAQAAAMSAAWDREYGDRNDPETQRAIAETVRMLEKMDAGARMPRNAPTVLG